MIIKKWLLITVLGITFCFGLFERSEGQEVGEEVFLHFRYQGVVNQYISTLYHNDQFYISVSELFSSLLIEYTVDSGRLRLDGNFPNLGRYSIRLNEQTVIIGSRTVNITADEFLVTEYGYYLKADLLGEVFALNISVDFGNLALILDTPYTMPVVAQRQRSVRRDRLLRSEQEIRRDFYKLRYERESSALNLGFFDYDITANYIETSTGINYNTRIGTEILGGDLQGSILGSYSETASVFRTTNMRWRYGVVDNPLLSIIQIGQNRTSGLLPSAITGIHLTNQPIEPRHLFGETSLSGRSVPDAEVELFRNNTLIKYTQADPDGHYRFNVPITFGSSQYRIRTYNPSGLLEERDIRYQIPPSFLPAGEVTYSLNAGRLDNPIAGSIDRGYTGQGKVQVGLSNRFTIGAGVDYFEDFHDNMPTISGTLSSRLFTNHLVTLEAANDAFIRGSIQALYANNANFSAEYTHFTAQGGIFNPGRLESVLRTNLFTPLQIGNFPLFLRWNFNVENRNTTNVFRYRVDLNTRIQRANIRLGYNDLQIDRLDWRLTPSARVTASTTYTFRTMGNRGSLFNTMFIRGNASYMPELNRFEMAEMQISRRVGSPGRFHLSFGRNFLANFNLIRFSFSLDFNSFRSNTNVRSARSAVNVSQSLRGSIGYDSSNQNFIMTNRQQVGQSAIAVRMFVDNNNSGTFDEGDTLIPDQAIRVERSTGRIQSKDGISYVTQLQAYRRYNLIVNKARINNPLLVPIVDRFSFITDPNQYKTIDIPFYTSGIIEGMVYRIRDGESLGLGGMRLMLTQVDAPEGIDPLREEIRTFSDGSFYAFEIPPGNYQIIVDQSQLDFLNARPDPERLEFTVRPLSEGDFVENLIINLKPRDPFDVDVTEEREADPVTVTEAMDETERTDVVPVEIIEDVPDVIIADEIDRIDPDDIPLIFDDVAQPPLLADELIRDPNTERTISDIEIFTQDDNCRFSIQMAEFRTLEEAFNGANRYEQQTGLRFSIYSGGPEDQFRIRTPERELFGEVLTTFNDLLSQSPGERPAIITQCQQHEQTGPLRYFIQLGAFPSIANAESLSERLENQFQMPSIIDDSDGRLNRVQAGPFHDRRELLEAFRVLANDDVAPGMYIMVDPESYFNVSLEYRLQVGLFSDPRDAVRYAFEISEAFGVDTFVIVDGSAVKVMVNKNYEMWDEVFRDFAMISAYDSENNPAIHLQESDQ